MRMKTCPFCKEKYLPGALLQANCCEKFECRAAYIGQHVEKQRKKRGQAERIAQAADRKAVRLKLEQLKTRSDYIKEAQRAFNAYIRERDKQQACICCGLPLHSGSVGGQYDCGHYRSIGSAPNLRFDPRNAHAQRKQCNRYGAGRAVDYRIGLIYRIGLEAVESLEADNEPRKWSIEELKAIKAEYVAKLKQLKEVKN